MKLPVSPSALLVAAIVLTGVGVVVSQVVGRSDGDSIPSVKVPSLLPLAQSGKAAFDANCAQCHGNRGSGTTKGPPLLHEVYNPGHHPDESFQRAVRKGVPQHHWRFGDMPAQPQVSDAELKQIVSYVRELQQANGIRWREHRM